MARNTSGNTYINWWWRRWLPVAFDIDPVALCAWCLCDDEIVERQMCLIHVFLSWFDEVPCGIAWHSPLCLLPHKIIFWCWKRARKKLFRVPLPRPDFFGIICSTHAPDRLPDSSGNVHQGRVSCLYGTNHSQAQLSQDVDRP